MLSFGSATKTRKQERKKIQMTRDEFLTREQRKKNVKCFEKQTTVQTIDENGEIVSAQIETTSFCKTSTEPNFVKVYYETMLAFNEIEGIPVAFVLCISSMMPWVDDEEPLRITMNRYARERIERECGVKSAQVSRYIKQSVEAGLLFKTDCRGVYEVNPFMIARGSWDKIKDLQCKFDFKGGKWTRTVTISKTPDEMEMKSEEELEIDARAEKILEERRAV